MKNAILWMIGCFLVGLVACKKESRLTEAKHHDVNTVTGAATGTVNNPVKLTVTYPYTNGCDYIGSFEESRAGNKVTIKALSKPVAKDAVCTQDAGTRTVEYNFTSATAGTFELQFLKPNGTTLNHTVTIQ
ncbi:MAG TPA: hypothetical protein VMR70_10270 [Flavisolibacter sp.]|nr:hypothetical protein [Flavisolibacter sp.]